MTPEHRAALHQAAVDKIGQIDLDLVSAEDLEVKRKLHLEREQLRFAIVALRTQDQANTQLEADAVSLMRKYGLLLPAPAKTFFRQLAAFLSWFDLERQLK